MQSPEIGRKFLTRVSEYLVTFPFDLKILQEAIAETELERGAREIAAAVLISSLSPQEGSGPERFVDDVMVLRIALSRIAKEGGEGVEGFRTRFAELYSRLDEDLQIFEQSLGPELWAWLGTRPTACCRMLLKGKRAGQYIDDETTWDQLYEDGLDFQTSYDVSETQIQNKLRRPEQLVEIIGRRHAEDLKKRA